LNAESHITNVAFQKNSDNYDEEKGGKYQLDKLRLYMITKFGLEPIEECFYNIQELVIKALIATSKIMMNDRRCFELYGFDVLIDSKLKPWLVEINGSPSMTPSTVVDGQLKMNLLDDTLTVVNLEGL
jgi:tubulin polyglutamylase TTLL9